MSVTQNTSENYSNNLKFDQFCLRILLLLSAVKYIHQICSLKSLNKSTSIHDNRMVAHGFLKPQLLF